MINQENDHLDYCNSIVDKLSEGESLTIFLNMTGFSLDLHKLVQSYYSNDVSQREKIKYVLKKSVNMLWSHLMPLDLSDEDNSILPAKFKGDLVFTNKLISFHDGELQIALILVKIAIILKDENLFKVANLIASYSKIKEDRIKDDTLTFDFKNGTIGIALLYQTIHFLTNEDFYLKRANYWYVKSEFFKSSFSKENHDFSNQNNEDTIMAFEAFKNPQDSFWRKSKFLEFEILLTKSH